ncbi:MAG: ribonuclease J [Thermoleophilaceae bacterium]
MSGTLRVLPLGGLGEIGKNMTVVEYEGRIVVVDTGLMFPTPDQLGIDLVLPDFTYLRERADDIEAIVLTHAHEDHVGALPYVLREIGETTVPAIYGGPLTVEMVRSKLEEHNLKKAPLQAMEAGEEVDAGPFVMEMVKMSHSIPDAFAVALTCDLGTTLLTGDYKFDQTPVDGVPADMARLAELGRDGVLLLCGDSTNVDRPGIALSESSVGPELERVFGRCEGRIVVTSFASNVHRVQQVVDAAAANGRKVALVGRSMRKYVNIARRLGHIDVPEGLLVGVKEIAQFPDHKLVIVSTGSQGEPLSALRRMAHSDHPQVDLHEGDTVIFSATPIPGNERAVNETVDRIYQLGAEVITARDAPIHASGHGYAEELKLMINLTSPALRDALPRRLPPASAARAAGRVGGGATRAHLPRRERAAARGRRARRPLRDARARRPRVRGRGRRGQRRGRGPARPAHALRRRHLHRRGHGLRAGRALGRPTRAHLPRGALPGGRRRGPRRAARRGGGLTGPLRPRGDPRDLPAPEPPARRPGGLRLRAAAPAADGVAGGGGGLGGSRGVRARRDTSPGSGLKRDRRYVCGPAGRGREARVGLASLRACGKHLVRRVVEQQLIAYLVMRPPSRRSVTHPGERPPI